MPGRRRGRCRTVQREDAILLSKRLILADYLLQFSGFLLATTSALLIGKTVLVANLLPLMRRFENEPLIKPVLFKSVVYTLLVLVVRLLEALVHYLVEGGVIGSGRFLGELLGQFSWNHFIVTQLWIFVLFLIYVSADELDERLGGGALYRAFFTRQPVARAQAT